MEKRSIIFIFLFTVFTVNVYPQLFEGTINIISGQLNGSCYKSGDINNDGIPDVLMGPSHDGLVYFVNLKGNGFVPQTIDKDSPSSLFISDMDNDRDNDIIGYVKENKDQIEDTITDDIVIYYNDGKGRFEKQLYPTGQDIVYLAIGDLNADNFKDILILANDGYFYVFMNPGPNINQKKAQVCKKINPEARFDFSLKNSFSNNLLSISDVNNDGLNDIVLGYNANVFLFFNKGKGDFEDPVVSDFQRGFYCLAVYDYNGDGFKDILIQNSDGLYQYINDRQNNFDYNIYLPNSGAVKSYQVNDMNDDGNPDILFNERYKIGWYKNAGDFLFNQREIIYNDVAENIYIVDVLGFDYDNDGKKDIVCFDNEFYKVFKHVNGDTFKLLQTRFDMGKVSDFCVGDFDGNNTTDLIATFVRDLNGPDDGTEGIFLFKNHKDNGFEISRRISKDHSRIIRSGDINRDGNPDFLVCYMDTVDYHYYFQWYENNSTASFIQHKVNSSFDPSPTDVVLADYDSDGYLDIVGFAYAYDNYLFWFRNNKGKNFEEKQILYTGHLQQLSHFRSDDFTGNGFLDFIVMDKSGSLFFLRNNDGESFDMEEIDPDKHFYYYTLADLNNDGKTDIVVNISDEYENTVETGWYKNLDNGHFSDYVQVDTITTKQHYPYGRTFATDINVDGAIDLITETNNSVYYYINDGTANFVLQEKEHHKYITGIKLFTDLDDDSDPDRIDYLNNDFFFWQPRLVWFKNRHNTKTKMYFSLCEGDSINFYGNWIKKSGDYTVAFNSQNNGDSIFILQLEVFGNTIASFDIDGPTSPAQYKDIEYLVAPESDSLTYLWDIENGMIKNVFHQTDATVNWGRTGEGLIQVTAINLKTKCTKKNNLNIMIKDFQEGDFTVYPNPAINVINMPVISDSVHAEFYNLNGSLVKTSSKSIVDLTELPRGVYILKMFNPKGKLLATKKIILQ